MTASRLGNSTFPPSATFSLSSAWSQFLFGLPLSSLRLGTELPFASASTPSTELPFASAPSSPPPQPQLPAPSSPRLQSASAPTGLAPASSKLALPRHHSSRPRPGIAQAGLAPARHLGRPRPPVGLGPNRPQPQLATSASASSLRLTHPHGPPTACCGNVPRLQQRVAIPRNGATYYLEPPDTATWSTNCLWRPRGPLSPATTIQAKHAGDTSDKCRNSWPHPAAACDSCLNQNSTCQPAAAAYPDETWPAA